MAEQASYYDEENVDPELEEKLLILDNLGQELAKTRADAINGRELSGIEKDWTEDEEHYEGVDDANRGEMQAWRTKPLGQTALNTDRATSSTVFFNITRPYCDAATARVGDMLLPTDDRGWSIRPTPVPELVDISEGNFPPNVERQIEEGFPAPPQTGDPDADTAALEQRDEAVQKTKDDLVDEMKSMMKEARAKAEKAEKRIEDWHIECQYHAEMRRVIEDAGKIGTGVLKGPIPVTRRHVAYKNGNLVMQEETNPESRRVDPWNCFPDPGCGSNIHDGGFFWERDDITRKVLFNLRMQIDDGYIPEQIDRVLEEGPHRATKQFKQGEGRRHELVGLIERNTKNLFEIWYYTGEVSREQLMACGCDVTEEDPEFISATVTMVNNHVIKANLNIFDTGDFPYDFMVWQQRIGMPWGIGVARQIRTPQRVVNGAARNMMDNAGLAGGAMWAFHQGIIEPIDGVYEIAPRKGWMAAEDADLDHLDNAFRFIEMPMRQAELQAIIELGLKMAEDVTGLPMLLQGQGGNAPDTLGGMTMLNNNAGTVMRRVARLFDDLITEPHVRRYYTYLLQYGEDDEKGDFQIDARGSSALVERDLNAQSIDMLGAIVTDPRFKLDPAKWAVENLKSKRLDPGRFQFEDDQWAEMMDNWLQMMESMGGAAPQVQAAQIRAETDLQKHEMTMQDKEEERQLKIAMETIQEEHYNQDREVAIALESLKREMDEMELISQDKRHMETIKEKLAEVTMKLQAQIALAKDPEGAPQVATPIAEPVGRAPQGQAFEK